MTQFRRMSVYAVLVLAACSEGDDGGAALSSRELAISDGVVVSQVYGGGGNGSAPFVNDYVELFNRGATSVPLAGWSVQYASATGTGHFGSNPIVALSGNLAPGQYYLVQLGSGGPTGAPLPTPDATGTVNMSATGGKVALVSLPTGLACNGGGTPCTAEQEASIVDLVGYGTANYFEGSPAPAASNTTAVFRELGGCAETNFNGADFETGAPAPRNTASATAACPTDLLPAVASTSPADGAFAAADTAIVVEFTELVTLVGSWASIVCSVSGAISAETSGGPQSYTLTPPAPFEPGETCTVTVVADLVADENGRSMASDFVFSFTIAPGVQPIHAIQGAAHLSPLAGAPVSTRGIVTAVAGNGFYLQEPVRDHDDATSEGIFVFTGGAPPVVVGDDATVTGLVTEFRPGCASGCSPTDSAFNNLTTTEIVSPAVEVISQGNALPAPIVIGAGGRVPPSHVIEDDAAGDVESGGLFDPAEDGIDFYESLEGMRVQVNDAVAVGPLRTFGGGSLELVLVGDGGAHAGPRTARGGVVLEPGDFNPERVFLANNLVREIPVADVGDSFPGAIVGVIDYTFGNFKLFATQPLPALAGGGLAREEVSFGPPGPADLDVAAFNVENLDFLDSQSKFDRLAAIVVDSMHSPDILALEEIQDNDGPANSGTVDATLTFTRFIAAIASAGGPTYEFRNVDPENNRDGGEPSGNIRVGFLFRTDRGLAFVDRPGAGALTPNAVLNEGGVPALAYSPGRIDPTNPAFTNSRKPLAAEFTFCGQTFFVIANHFNSKGGDQPLFGRFQPPVLSSEVQRTAQAHAVADFVAAILAIDAAANVIVLGDLNDFPFSAPLLVLKAAGLAGLIETLPGSERYSYVFEGNSQVLDHILVSAHALSRKIGFDVVHVNAEFADQASDHDPGVTRFSTDEVAPVLSSPGDIVAEATGPGGAAVSFVVTATDDVDGDVAVSCSPPSGSLFPLGATAVVCSAEDGGGNRAETSFTVTVVDSTPPALAGVPDSISAFATSSGGAHVSYATPTATDLVDGPTPVACSPASGSTFAPGQNVVVCSAVDSAGNIASQSFSVVVTFSAPLDGSFYLSPIKPDGSAEFRTGSIIPVRFRLTGPSAGIPDLDARLFVYRIEDGELIPVLRRHNRYLYIFPIDRYFYPLITFLWKPGLYLLRTELGDGVAHEVQIRLTRRR